MPILSLLSPMLTLRLAEPLMKCSPACERAGRNVNVLGTG